METAKPTAPIQWDRWLGPFDLVQDTPVRFRLGALTLWVHRRRNEWVLAWRRQADSLADDVEVNAPVAADSIPDDDDTDTERFMCNATSEALVLSPRLADRPVVSRPEDRLTVLPRQQVELWISTPLWIQLHSADGALITELPAVRMSDTWFGENTRRGELCYATRTRARASGHPHPHPVRALTRILVANRHDEPLHVDRLNLPLPNLTLYRSEAGFWTSEVHVTRSDGDEDTEVEISDGSSKPEDRVCEPRQPAGGDHLLRGFRALLR